jgi:hypothetical protein
MEEYQREITMGAVFEHPSPPPHTYPVTVAPQPPGSTSLYNVAGHGPAIAWEAAAGSGRVIYVGIAPGFFKTSDAGPAWLRALVAHALGSSGGKYREAGCFLLHRGPYTAIRTLDAPYSLRGRYVDLLSPKLELLDNPRFKAQECVFLSDGNAEPGAPSLLATSGRLRASAQGQDSTAFLVEAPWRTEGVARVWAGGRTLRSGEAHTVFGVDVPLRIQAEGKSVLLEYPNHAEGTVIRLEWEKS